MKQRVWLIVLITVMMVLALSMGSPKSAHAQASFTIAISVDPPEAGTVTIAPVKDSYNWFDLVSITTNPRL